LVAVAAVLGLIVSACSAAAGAGAPTSAYQPAPSMSDMSGADTSPAASTPPSSTGPSTPGPTSATPGPSGTPATTSSTLHIAAQNIQFDTTQLDAPADQAFVLEFANNDAGVPHNVEIKDATGASSFKGQIITGPAKASYQIPALAAGTYTFLCDVHPTMTGTLTVS
jgi:plastocyanin